MLLISTVSPAAHGHTFELKPSDLHSTEVAGIEASIQ